MPHKTKTSLPDNVRDNLPPHAQTFTSRRSIARGTNTIMTMSALIVSPEERSRRAITMTKIPESGERE